MAQNDNELLFGEREQLLTDSINQMWSWRSKPMKTTDVRGHLKNHIAALRSIRGARAAYNDGLRHALRQPSAYAQAAANQTVKEWK